jgi:uncharacterized membrane protein YidH (DUF202 family)
MILGHWYLVERRLSNRYMVWMAWANVGAVLAGLGSVLLSARNAVPCAGLTDAALEACTRQFSPVLLIGSMTIVLGLGVLALVALISGFNVRLAREGGRSIQASTGMFYLAVILALTAVLATVGLVIGKLFGRRDLNTGGIFRWPMMVGIFTGLVVTAGLPLLLTLGLANDDHAGPVIGTIVLCVVVGKPIVYILIGNVSQRLVTPAVSVCALLLLLAVAYWVLCSAVLIASKTVSGGGLTNLLAVLIVFGVLLFAGASRYRVRLPILERLQLYRPESLVPLGSLDTETERMSAAGSRVPMPTSASVKVMGCPPRRVTAASQECRGRRLGFSK